MSEKKYFAGIRDMAVAMIGWTGEHPTEQTVILFDDPAVKAGIIGTVADAFRFRFIRLNEPALKMFTELGFLDDSPTAPTVIMLKTALELMQQSREKALEDRR